MFNKLGPPLAMSEGMIDIITNVRNKNKFTIKGKTGGIDVRHFEVFWEVGFKLGRGLEILNHPTPFISATASGSVRVRVTDCLGSQSGLCIMHHVHGGQSGPIHGI